MAGDWIKFRKSLLKDGRVKIVSRTCHADSVTVIGALVTLWCVADEHADEKGVLLGYTPDDINREVSIKNFCEALPSDWVDVSGEWVKLPEYQAHNGDTAKKRCQNQLRKAKQRSSRSMCDESVTKSVTREEKRREERESRAKPFSPPSVDDVKQYCRERNNHIDPERFVNFYTSKGWVVGKSKMKDWKSAVRSWESRDKQKQQGDEKTIESGRYW